MSHRIILTAAVLTMMVAGAAAAQTPSKHSTSAKPVSAAAKPAPVARVKAPPANKVELKEAQPGLAAMATVSVDNALKTAMKERSGTLISERIEKRHDQLVYVFGIRTNHRVQHVTVDAHTGAIVKPLARSRKSARTNG